MTQRPQISDDVLTTVRARLDELGRTLTQWIDALDTELLEKRSSRRFKRSLERATRSVTMALDELKAAEAQESGDQDHSASGTHVEIEALLNALCAATPASEVEEQADDPSVEEGPGGLRGHSHSVGIPELLGFLASMGKSGVLRIRTEAENFVLQLVEGSVVFAHGDNPPEGQRLGEILVARGVLSAVELEEEVARAQEHGDYLGSSLVRGGLVSREDLGGALAYQTQELFHRIHAATDADFEFNEGHKSGNTEELQLNVTRLLLESARTSDEAQGSWLL